MSRAAVSRAAAVFAVVAGVGSAGAFAPRTGGSARARMGDELTALPGAKIDRPLRAQPTIAFERKQTPAWRHFVAAEGAGWRAAWDRATQVPSRIWGPGIAAPGANASAAIAEWIARRVLAEHLALLAPGATPSDFALAANHSDGEIRSVGFVQQVGGRRVVGGQVSFRFKRDRLFVIASEALPRVEVEPVRARLAGPVLVERAAEELRARLALPAAPAKAIGPEVVLPLVGEAGVIGYRVAARVELDGGADGKYLAYVAPATGAVIAVQQQHRYATGALRYLGVDRHPLRGRRAVPAARAHVTAGGAPQTTSAGGTVVWSPEAPIAVEASVVGDLVMVNNSGATGARATQQLTLAPGGSALWDASGDSERDAQVVVFLAVNAAKAHVRARLDPALPLLDEQLTANVNLANTCNAFFDGSAINFFTAGGECQNAALIEDVVYHELGHAVHIAEIIDGVGAFDPALSEGAADFLAASITGDPGVGRGFFYDDRPLRQLDPPGEEATWPEDISESHATGLIYGGALWDLRTAAIAALGEAEGSALVERIYVATMRRATSIPTSVIEALAADDDDGNLANGTPHECLIRAAFGRHGLRTASAAATAPGALDTPDATVEVTVDVAGLAGCASEAIDRVDLIWLPGYTRVPAAGSAPMTEVAPGRYTAPLPLPSDDVVRYSARVRFADGTTLVAADNLGDPYYSLYRGPTVPLYCTSFDDGDPFAAGWTTGTSDGSPSPWAWGAPAGAGTDPASAYSGARILGQNLAGDYPPSSASWVRLPDIDPGTWSDVHLQYRRWLATEDSYFDPAQITVNGQLAWVNTSDDPKAGITRNHIDREWRFHDVRASGFGTGRAIRIAFEHEAQDDIQLGGWSLDDVCVVANTNAICGDGIRTPTEQCDDGPGNADAPDTCRTWCQLPACGDGITDSGEACDDGPEGSAACSAQCEAIAPSDDGGCCSTSRRGNGVGSMLLGAGVATALARRRRRR